MYTVKEIKEESASGINSKREKLHLHTYVCITDLDNVSISEYSYLKMYLEIVSWKNFMDFAFLHVKE